MSPNSVQLSNRSIAYGSPRQLEWFLRLSLVTCPVALYPATSDAEKVSFNQINQNTGHRIKYKKVDAETGDGARSGFEI
ncbi:hypothetical protein HMPREF9695_00580 [Afipia broomeae ATCC 49717]|uniref:Ku domain-containing protein n=1 Tax=Afipia broomeae ATCC 49717 TaxID=883078 RepID=K8PSY8_9BRAD|nr:hypothetical protein HMPREF9695_00580 [Afipia broomeae ATCC 49717]